MNSPQYWVFRKWGRIGVSQGGTKIEEFGANKDKALKNFAKQYLDKTGNTFGHARDAFVTLPGKMLRVDVDHKALSKNADGGESAGGEVGTEECAVSVGGKLSKKQIEKADVVLDRIEASLPAEGETLAAAVKAQLL